MIGGASSRHGGDDKWSQIKLNVQLQRAALSFSLSLAYMTKWPFKLSSWITRVKQEDNIKTDVAETAGCERGKGLV